MNLYQGDICIENHSKTYPPNLSPDYSASGFRKIVQLDLINLIKGGKFHTTYRRFIL